MKNKNKGSIGVHSRANHFFLEQRSSLLFMVSLCPLYCVLSLTGFCHLSFLWGLFVCACVRWLGIYAGVAQIIVTPVPGLPAPGAEPLLGAEAPTETPQTELHGALVAGASDPQVFFLQCQDRQPGFPAQPCPQAHEQDLTGARDIAHWHAKAPPWSCPRELAFSGT